MRRRRRRVLPSLYLIASAALATLACEPPAKAGELERLNFRPAPDTLLAQGSVLEMSVEHRDGKTPSAIEARSTVPRTFAVTGGWVQGDFKVEAEARAPGTAALEIHGVLMPVLIDRLSFEVARIDAFTFPDVRHADEPLRIVRKADRRVTVAATDRNDRRLGGHPEIQVSVSGDAVRIPERIRLNREVTMEAVVGGLAELTFRDPVTSRTGTLTVVVLEGWHVTLDWTAESGVGNRGGEQRAYTDLVVRLLDERDRPVDGARCAFQVRTSDALEHTPTLNPCQVRLWWKDGAVSGSVRVEETLSGQAAVIHLDAP